MTSDKQWSANKANARLGGLRSDSDTSRTRFNALQHGLTSKGLLDWGGLIEDRDDYDSFQKVILNDLKPKSAIEELLAIQLAKDFFKLKRFDIAEAQCFSESSYDGQPDLNIKKLKLINRYKVSMQSQIRNNLKTMQSFREFQTNGFVS
jgi:hypothetical protein